MLNSNDVSEYLKIAADGLQVIHPCLNVTVMKVGLGLFVVLFSLMVIFYFLLLQQSLKAIHTEMVIS